MTPPAILGLKDLSPGGKRLFVERVVIGFAVGILAGVVGLHRAAAQSRTVIDGPIGYRSWSIGAGLSNDKLNASQFVVPIYMQSHLGSRIDLTTSITAAGSSLSLHSGSSAQLNGVSSLMSQLFVHVANDRAMLQTGVTLPTGTHSLDAEEIGVWEVLSLPVLGFPLRHYGRGFEWNGGLSVARHLGDRGSGSVGVGVVLRAPYELIAGHKNYRPAPELSMTTGFDLGGQAQGSATRSLDVDLTYRVIGTHRERSQRVLDEGNQLELQASGTRETARFFGSAYIRAVSKGDYVPYDTTGREIDRLRGSSGTSVSTRLTGASRLGTAQWLGLAGEWNLLRNSDGFAHDGHAFGVGPYFDSPLGSHLQLHLEAVYLGGGLNAGADASAIDLHGASVSASLRWGATE